MYNSTYNPLYYFCDPYYGSYGCPLTAPFNVKSWGLPSDNFIYPANASAPLDAQGIQVVVDAAALSGNGFAAQIARLSAGVFQETILNNFAFGDPVVNSYTASCFIIVPYVAGQAAPTCNFTTATSGGGGGSSTPYVYPTVTPSCSGNNVPSGPLGDPNVADYANQSAVISPDILYTNSFVPTSSSLTSFLAIGITDNTKGTSYIDGYLGLYNSTGGLLASCSFEVYAAPAQIVYCQMQTNYVSTSIQLIAGQRYTVGVLVEGAPLHVAATTTKTAQLMPYGPYNYAVPPQINSTLTGPAVSVGVIACVPASHSFCSFYQYSIPGSSGSTTTYLYQGLLSAGATASNAYGSYFPVQMLGGHLTINTRFNNYPVVSDTLYGIKASSAIAGNVYTSTTTSGQLLDTAGLNISASSINAYPFSTFTTTLQFSPTFGTLQDFAAVRTCPGNQVAQSFTVTPISAGIPNCNLVNVPVVVRGAATAPATCANGLPLVILGDASETDLGYDVQGDTYMPSDQINVRSVTTGSVPVLLSQLSFGLNPNYVAAGHLMMAVYASNLTLVGTTAEVSFTNTATQQLIVNLTAPVALSANTQYYFAIWTDTAIWAGFGVDNTIADAVPYQSGPASWPTLFTSNTVSSSRAIGGFGCPIVQLPRVASATASVCFIFYSLPGNVDYPFSVATSLTVAYDPTPITTASGTAVTVVSGTGTRTYTNRFGISTITPVTVAPQFSTSGDNLLYNLSSASSLPVDQQGLTLLLPTSIQLPGAGPSVLYNTISLYNQSAVVVEAGGTRYDRTGEAFLSSIPGFVNSTLGASNINNLAAIYSACQAPISCTTTQHHCTSPTTPSLPTTRCAVS